MTSTRPIPRQLALLVLLAMAAFATVGFFTIRKDVENLRVISQDNTQWAASQMEIELLRFRMSLQRLLSDPSPEAVEAMHERFDILWSRVFMTGHGRLGESLARYDGEHGSVAAIAEYMEEIDPILAELDPADTLPIASIERVFDNFQQELRQYTLRVMRADGAAGALVRMRIQSSARTTALISIAAVLVSVLSLYLILRENRRQRQIAEMSRRSAEQAEMASRAKSRFLSMMSHELRNPLNGVLGPLALLGQGDLGGRQKRLLLQAQQSGQAMLQMLSGLLDYGELQDGRFQLRVEPFRTAALAAAVRASLLAEGMPQVGVEVRAGTPERLRGDLDRLRQALVHLALYVLDDDAKAVTRVELSHDGHDFVGEIGVSAEGRALDWKLDLLTDLAGIAPDQVSAEALRPLIARGLVAASGGCLGVVDAGGSRTIRVTVPAEPLGYHSIRVHLETRSAAMATIYQAALKSDRVIFEPEGGAGVDVVLVDSTSVGELPLMSRLKARFPGALFISLGTPQMPDFFDEVVDPPNDMARLRGSILGRLAS